MSIEQAMKRCIELALRGSGYVHPNPRVGCVLLKDGKVIAEGWHKKAGAPHAEIDALQSAREDPAGATLVVNLEPCVHHGKTPPCVDAIIEKNIARVVIGTLDPNPIVNGKGVEKLRAAGIDVLVGVLEDQCQWINRYFFKYIRTGIPYVILKVAQTLDGFIATLDGTSQWITNELSRKRVHQLRSEVRAVLIGSRTALYDNPSLTTRLVSGPSPYRIILDPDLSLPLHLKLFSDDYATQTMIACRKEKLLSEKAKIFREKQVELLAVPEKTPGKFDLIALLNILGEKEIPALLVEGGAYTFSQFVEENLVDEYHFFIAPKLLGRGIAPFESLSHSDLPTATAVHPIGIEQLESDIHLLALPEAVAIPAFDNTKLSYTHNQSVKQTESVE